MDILIAVLPYLIGLSLLAVVVTLFTGFTSMTRGGEFNKRWGNTLMRLRVITQAVAVVLVVLYFLLTRAQ